jgi:ankyrin repeat protein
LQLRTAGNEHETLYMVVRCDSLKQSDGNTALHAASQNGDVIAIGALVKSGADVAKRNM